MFYDCVIVGGGIVGTTLAHVFGQLKYRVLVIEKNIPEPKVENFNSRTLALSYASAHIYQTLQLWDKLTRVIPIQEVQVSVQDQYGISRLNRRNQIPNALGFVVSFDELEQMLYQTLSQQETVEVRRPATVTGCESEHDQWRLQVECANELQSVSCRLLVAADGEKSALRAQQSIPFQEKEYGHYAVMANVRVRSLQQGVAYERFLTQGAIALLPWQENTATLIWTTTKAHAQLLHDLSDEDFLQQCQDQFGRRIGHFLQGGKRIIFPLQMKLATEQVGARFLLMGNAAHSLHPIAAQGLNLSLRDLWQIRSQLLKATRHCDVGSESFLSEYSQAREADQQRIIWGTDKIAEFMSGDRLPNWLRALGITLFDSMPLLKRKFIQISMGL